MLSLFRSALFGLLCSLQSALIFSLLPSILYPRPYSLSDPICSDLLAILLSASFFFVLLHSASIVSNRSPWLCLLRSACSVSSLLISDFSNHANLYLLFYVMISWIRSDRISAAQFGAAWISSALSFAHPDLQIFSFKKNLPLGYIMPSSLACTAIT